MKKFFPVFLVLLLLVYLGTVAAVTINAQLSYRESLPSVKLSFIEEGVLSADCITNSDMTGLFAVNMVERTRGPWGDRFVIRQIELSGYVSIDNNSLYVFGYTDIPLPIAYDEDYPLADGMEVRIRTEDES